MGFYLRRKIYIWKYLSIAAMAALPIVELRGAIPYGIGAIGMHPWIVFVIAYLGSVIVSPIIILFFRPVVNWIYSKDFKLLKKLARWSEERGYRKSSSVRKYSLLGLFAFVAIPLPGTGVWMGSLIATLLKLRIGHAFPTIALGNMVAGLLMMLLSDFFFGGNGIVAIARLMLG